MGLRQASIIVIALVFATAASAAAPGKRDKDPNSPRKPAPPVPKIADRDGNKIFDDLEAKMAAASPDAKHKVIVTLNERLTDTQIAALQAAAGRFAVSSELPIIEGFAATATKGQIQALARHDLVSTIARDAPVHAFNADEQGAFGVTKAKLDDYALDGRNWFGPSPANVVVAVIDTGIDLGHQDMFLHVVGWNDLVNGNPTAYDDNGHGTHVAATIAGGDPKETKLQDGVAPGSKLVGIKVLNSEGVGSTSTIVAGINWMVANRATYNIKVANMSLGSDGCSSGVDPLSAAVNNAVAAGIAMVVAAGNSGPASCTIGPPAATANAITVGAAGAVSDDPYTLATGLNLAYFSSRGPTLDGRSKPDLVAPGVNVRSALAGTIAGYTDESGTSMASPFVAGLAALMLDVNAGLSYEALRSAGAPLGAAPAVPTDQYLTGSLGGTGAVQTFYVNAAANSLIGGTLIIPGWIAPGYVYPTDPDFDLFLIGPLGPNQQLLTTSEGTIRQEDVDFRVFSAGLYAFQVYSYNGAGPFSLELQNVQMAPPTPNALPSIGGFVGVDRTVTGVSDFAGWPTPNVIPTFLSCDTQGANCTPPPYANLFTFQLNPWDYGHSLRFHTDVFNALGGTARDSVPYEVLPEKPFNFTPPAISGVTQVGETLAATPGVWREPPYPATEPIGKTYQWFDCPAPGPGACTPIPGASSSTLRLMQTDQDKNIEVVVTGANRGGSTDVTSAQTATVAPPRPSPPRPSEPLPAPSPQTDTRPNPTPPPPPSGGTRPTTPLPDLAIAMTSNPPPGSIFGVSQITYTMDVTNQSDVFATNATLNDVLPANLSYVSGTVDRSPLTCTSTAQIVTCPLGSLAGSDTIRVVIVANVTSAAFTTNSARVTELQPDANPANNTAAITHS